MLRAETQVGTEQKVLPHRQSAHQDIILEAHGWFRHEALDYWSNPKYNTVKEYVCAYVCIYIPEPHRQSWAWGQTWRLCHPPRLFLAAVQQGLFFLRLHLAAWQKDKLNIHVVVIVHVCKTVAVCLHVHKHVSYDVLPLPVAPMIAFIPGLMMPLQQPIGKSILLIYREHFNIL